MTQSETTMESTITQTLAVGNVPRNSLRRVVFGGALALGSLLGIGMNEVASASEAGNLVMGNGDGCPNGSTNLNADDRTLMPVCHDDPEYTHPEVVYPDPTVPGEQPASTKPATGGNTVGGNTTSTAHNSQPAPLTWEQQIAKNCAGQQGDAELSAALEFAKSAENDPAKVEGSGRLVTLAGICDIQFVGDVNPIAGRQAATIELIILDPSNQITANSLQAETLETSIKDAWDILHPAQPTTTLIEVPATTTMEPTTTTTAAESSTTPTTVKKAIVVPPTLGATTPPSVPKVTLAAITEASSTTPDAEAVEPQPGSGGNDPESKLPLGLALTGAVAVVFAALTTASVRYRITHPRNVPKHPKAV